MRTNFSATGAVAVTIALSACGGGGDDAPAPVVSSTPFAVRATLDNIFITAGGIAGATGGRDNVAVPSSVGGTPLFTIYNDWSGRISASRRLASASFIASTPNCAGVFAFIDVTTTSTRKRDGFVLTENASFGYDTQYRQICALVSDGRYWTWSISEPLPATAFARGSLTGVQMAGTSRTGEGADIDSTLTGNVSLDPDTETSAYLNFSYAVTPFSTLPSYRAFGSNSKFQFRISTTGSLLGFSYARTGYLPEISGALVHTTLTLDKL